MKEMQMHLLFCFDFLQIRFRGGKQKTPHSRTRLWDGRTFRGTTHFVSMTPLKRKRQSGYAVRLNATGRGGLLSSGRFPLRFHRSCSEGIRHAVRCAVSPILRSLWVFGILLLHHSISAYFIIFYKVCQGIWAGKALGYLNFSLLS